MAKNQALSLRAQWLGERLRTARLRAGHTLEDVAEYLEIKHPTISRFERGLAPIRASYIRDFIAFYGISDPEERDTLLRLNQDAWRKDWSDIDPNGLNRDFLDYTWLESRASKISDYEPMLIPGLLQTADYTRAVMRYDDSDPAILAQMAEIRRTRQQILHREQPTPLSVVVEDAVLRRPTGGVEVLKQQLAHLLEMTQRPHIQVQVLPITIEWNPGHTGPFTYFDMPDPYPEVAYIESLVGRTFIEAEDKVSHYREAYRKLTRIALSPTESIQHIKAVLEESA